MEPIQVCSNRNNNIGEQAAHWSNARREQDDWLPVLFGTPAPKVLSLAGVKRRSTIFGGDCFNLPRNAHPELRTTEMRR